MEGGRGGGWREERDEVEKRNFFFLGEGHEEKERKEGRRRNCTESFGPVVEVGRNPPRSQSERDLAMGPAASSSRETVVVVRTGVMPWQPRSEEWRWRERTNGIEKVLDVYQDGHILLFFLDCGLWLVGLLRGARFGG